jgi:ABC-type uncharacterized transport system fused permease/ATPase subunit
VRYAVAPYLYLWTTFVLTSKLAPVKWGKVNGKLRELFAAFRASVSRVLVHQEAIAAMKGAQAERAVVRRRFAELAKHTHDVTRISAWHGLVNQLGFSYVSLSSATLAERRLQLATLFRHHTHSNHSYHSRYSHHHHHRHDPTIF